MQIKVSEALQFLGTSAGQNMGLEVEVGKGVYLPLTDVEVRPEGNGGKGTVCFSAPTPTE
jgi:hypothetical protein